VAAGVVQFWHAGAGGKVEEFAIPSGFGRIPLPVLLWNTLFTNETGSDADSEAGREAIGSSGASVRRRLVDNGMLLGSWTDV
jgi:hypothetical protein